MSLIITLLVPVLTLLHDINIIPIFVDIRVLMYCIDRPSSPSLDQFVDMTITLLLIIEKSILKAQLQNMICYICTSCTYVSNICKVRSILCLIAISQVYDYENFKYLYINCVVQLHGATYLFLQALIINSTKLI